MPVNVGLGPIEAGVALDVIGQQIFIVPTLADLSCWYSVSVSNCGKWNIRCHLVTPRASPTITGDRKENHTQPIGNKECQGQYMKTDLIGQ
jgi:hypothetical protein